MKCLNCGCTSENYLCAACTNEAVLDKIFKEIRFYKPDTCENPYLLEFASGLTEKSAEREIIPDILKLFRCRKSSENQKICNLFKAEAFLFNAI